MKTFKIGIALVVVVAAIIVFAHTLINAIWISPGNQEGPPPLPTSALPSGKVSPQLLPMRLIIPSLSIDAKVQQTGLNTKGNMGVPTNFTDVAWYKYGAVPGQVGSAVIDGHVDNGLGLPGVFKNLSDIQKGADIFVDTDGGQQLHFVVDTIESYPYQNAPTALIFDHGDTSRLNLITCEGDWVSKDRTYNERFVVFAKLAEK